MQPGIPHPKVLQLNRRAKERNKAYIAHQECKSECNIYKETDKEFAKEMHAKRLSHLTYKLCYKKHQTVKNVFHSIYAFNSQLFHLQTLKQHFHNVMECHQLAVFRIATKFPEAYRSYPCSFQPHQQRQKVVLAT